MIYLLYGDTYKITKEINKIISDNKIEEINISKYELDAYNYKDIIEDAETVSLFDDKKAIIVDDADIFTSAKISFELDLYEKYIANCNPNTILIFVLESDKLDERKKIVKLIRKHGVVKEFGIDDNPNNLIKSLLEDYKMDTDAKNKFIELVMNDTYNIINEIEKLKLYKYEDKVIKLEDVLNITTKNVDSDLFKLMDAIIENDKDSAITNYHNLLLYNIEPIQIIISLANKYRLMYQVKDLYRKGYTEGDIAKELKQSPKYVFVLNKISRTYDSKFLLNELKKMAKLDYDIKSGNIDASLALELYILKK